MNERRWKKKTFLLITAILIIGGYVFYKIKKQSFLDHKLQGVVQDKTKQLYKISYDFISVNEVGGNLFIKNLHIEGDTLVQLEMIKRGDSNASKMLLDIYIPLLKVNNFKTAKALLSKQLDCEQVVISDPRIKIYLFPGQPESKDSKRQREELYKQILGKFKLIKAENISVVNSEVVATDFYTNETKFHTYNTSIYLSDVAIDSTYNQDTTRTLFCKEIDIKCDKVILGEKNTTAEITNASFNTRSEVVTLSKFEYDAYKNKGFFKSSLEGISLKGVAWNGPVENSDLVIDNAVFDKGELEILTGSGGNSKTNSNKNKRILTGWIKSFQLNNLHLKSIAFTSRPKDPKKNSFTVNNSSLIIRNIQLDRASELNESLIAKAREIEISNDEINITNKEKFYNYQIQGLQLNTLARRITIRSLKVIPLLNESDFAKKMKFQSDRFDIKLKNIEFNKVDIGRLLKGEVRIDNIVLNNNSINVFRDLSYPIDSMAKSGPQNSYPHQQFCSLEIPVNINKLVVRQAYIEYKEKNSMSQSSGRVRFSNSNITINNINNSPAKENEKIIASFASTFLDKIPVTGSFTFYKANYQKGKFMVDVAIPKSFEASTLSQLTQPMALANIDKGTVYSFKANFTADTSISKGSLAITYDDLKISMLKKKGSEYKKKDLLSFLANIIVKNKNKKGEGMRTANIELKSDKYRSFFNLIWKSIFTGLRKTITLKI